MTAEADDLIEALQAPAMTAVAVAKRIVTFEALGYYVAPLTKDQNRARVVVFTRALETIPGPFVAGSFDEWFERMSRAPTPGDIGNGARSLMRRAKDRVRYLRPKPLPPRDPEPTQEEIDRRRRFGAKMEVEFRDVLGREGKR